MPKEFLKQTDSRNLPSSARRGCPTKQTLIMPYLIVHKIIQVIINKKGRVHKVADTKRGVACREVKETNPRESRGLCKPLVQCCPVYVLLLEIMSLDFALFEIANFGLDMPRNDKSIFLWNTNRMPTMTVIYKIDPQDQITLNNNKNSIHYIINLI